MGRRRVLLPTPACPRATPWPNHFRHDVLTLSGKEVFLNDMLLGALMPELNNHRLYKCTPIT